VTSVRFPLVGSRVELRPFALSDAAVVHSVYSDERVMRWVGGGPVHRLDQTEAMVREYIDHQNRHGFSFWVVTERSSGELIGDAGLYTRDGEIELGYTLGYEHWGRGYGVEAAGLCVKAAFAELRAPEVVALVQPANERSAALVAKLGFVPDGEAVAHGAPHTLYRLTPEAFDACLN
jgi:[ribosomal protein S5]-alanine N-acetyltransferase